jgi:glycosyltransferase involved in cell wall biosynthesis
VGWNAKAALAHYLKNPSRIEDVTIIENAPQIEEYFKQSTILLYPPEMGTGMKVKIMEAFCYGVPVVTTSDGIEGIPAKDGVHARIGHQDSELVAKTLELLHDVSAQNRQRKAARVLIEEVSGPKAYGDRLEGIYQEILLRTSK